MHTFESWLICQESEFKFKDQLEPKNNVIFKRALLNQRAQQEGESVHKIVNQFTVHVNQFNVHVNQFTVHVNQFNVHMNQFSVQVN